MSRFRAAKGGVRYVLLVTLFKLLASGAALGAEETMLVYIASVPGKAASHEQGIYTTTIDLATGKLAEPKLATRTNRSSFIWIHPNGRFLYACNEIDDYQGKKAGGVSAFSIDDARSGALTKLNDQPSGGANPCYVRLDASGEVLLVANYGSGSVAALPVDPETGKLSPPAASVQHQGSSVDPKRQEGPHAHSFNPSPDNRFALACDLGLDKVLVYRLDQATAGLTCNDPPFATVAPGSGPRHLDFSADGKFAYVGNEMGNTVSVFSCDAEQGVLSEIQSISTLPDDFDGKSQVSETALHPSGKFLYSANRGHNSIAVFSVDQATGKLTPAGHTSVVGDWPRHFRIDPSGRWMLVANQNSGSVVSFAIDQTSGAITATGSSIQLTQPMCIMFYDR